jgi:hypothetical protein
MSDEPRPDAATEATLPDAERHLHHALLESVLATGEAPPPPALAAQLGIGLDAVRDGLQTLRRADYLALDAAGRVTCLYPFSPILTAHVVAVGEMRRYAMCAIDALGVAAMLGRPVAIESACPVCGAQIRVDVRPGAVARVDPAGAMVVAKSDAEAPACEACCAFTVFACGPDHARDVRDRTPGSAVLDLGAALGAGEGIFGGFLADALPAKRRRAQAVMVREP